MKAEYPNFVPLITPSKGFEELRRLIVDAEICSLCGGCAALCQRLELDQNGPKKREDQECNLVVGGIKCSEDGSCYDACPMVPFSWAELETLVFGKTAEDEDLGVYQEITAVRSKDPEIQEKAQDGGAVTSVLVAGIQGELLEGAIVASRTDQWLPEAKIASSRDEIIASAGTKYAQVPSASLTAEAFRQGAKNVALVGTGCQNVSVRRLQNGPLKNVPNISISLIGLFCFENFPYDDLKESFRELFGIEMPDVLKQNITKGKFIVTKEDGTEAKASVRKFDSIVPKTCKYCTNFTSKLSDLSIGSIGSPTGWSTVIVRTEKGKALLDAASKLGLVEVSDNVDIDQIRKNVLLKRKQRAGTEGSDPYAPQSG
ncbi:MAG: Coenzyme F420 hydrogenase/dehydrogenase, beta subunit C-terminal domain [Candidatus Hodarchaeales archaeon]|jgi:coenzyme F420 hydrogenase subunit beta